VTLEDEKTKLEKEIENLDRHRHQLQYVLNAHTPRCTFINPSTGGPTPDPPGQRPLRFPTSGEPIHVLQNCDFPAPEEAGIGRDSYEGLVYREGRSQCMMEEKYDPDYFGGPFDLSSSSSRFGSGGSSQKGSNVTTSTHSESLNDTAKYVTSKQPFGDSRAPVGRPGSLPRMKQMGFLSPSGGCAPGFDLGLDYLADGHTGLTPITGCSSMDTLHFSSVDQLGGSHAVTNMSPTTLMTL